MRVMSSGQVALPDNRNYEYGYRSAYKLACEQLAGVDVKKQCLNSGARCIETGSQKAVVIDYLGRPYHIALPGVEISPADRAEDVPIRDKLLLLHYFLRAKGTPASGRKVAFKELPGGAGYFPTFAKRAIRPLVSNFSQQPARLVEAARKMGGQPVDGGDAAVTIRAFPRVPVTIILWQGDEELAAEGSLLFDASISDYLSGEDIVVLCETIAWRLVKSVR